MAFDGSRLQYYLDREREVREVADRCRNDDLREQLEGIADQYAALAQQVAKGMLRSQ